MRKAYLVWLPLVSTLSQGAEQHHFTNNSHCAEATDQHLKLYEYAATTGDPLFDFKQLEGLSARDQQLLLFKYATKERPDISCLPGLSFNMVVKDLKLEVYRINEFRIKQLSASYSNSQIQQLAEQLNQKNSELTLARAQLSDYQQHLHQLGNQVRTHEEQLTSVRADYKAGQSQISALEQQLRTAAERFNTKKLKFGQRKNQYDQEASILREEIIALRQAATNNQETLITTQQHLSLAEQDILQKHQQLEALHKSRKEEIHHLKEKLALQEELAKTKQHDLAESYKRLLQLEGDLQEKQQQLAASQALAASAQQNLDKQTACIAKLESELGAKQQYLIELQAIHSEQVHTLEQQLRDSQGLATTTQQALTEKTTQLQARPSKL
ncbi:hypothetical protein [Candidatus Odyssella thessalonicensis]|uniref:hypothetical protein n=1 Tax=Candidatus Odyssella thessalonicensis TaxID=84647 RepID=UPI000225B4D4|nr:hypothetical protein [Candidatus Odyssella thessalonicensis]